MQIKKIRHPAFLLPLAAALLAGAMFLALSIGSVPYPVREIVEALFTKALSKTRDIIVSIRLPRVLLAALVGMNLAVSGAYMQAVMKNPLADPGIIGVSSGAALAGVTVMLLLPGLSYLVPVFAFLGGCLACMVVFSLAWKRGADPVRIILAGVAVNALLGGGVSLLSLLYSDRIQGVLLWVNGSLSGKSLPDVQQMLPFCAAGILLAALCIPYANALLLGDDMAKSLGIPVNAARICLSAVSAYLTGISIAAVGLIGFIGLIVPHVARLLIGSDYKTMIPFSALLGGLLLVSADCVARTAFRPIEIPVGVVMSVIGGPFFVALLRRKRRV